MPDRCGLDCCSSTIGPNLLKILRADVVVGNISISNRLVFPLTLHFSYCLLYSILFVVFVAILYIIYKGRHFHSEDGWSLTSQFILYIIYVWFQNEMWGKEKPTTPLMPEKFN